MACNLVLSELEDAEASEEITKRVRAIVERILAKAKQHSGVIYNLISVHFGCNHKAAKTFVDMQSENKNPKKSWHFQVN